MPCLSQPFFRSLPGARFQISTSSSTSAHSVSLSVHSINRKVSSMLHQCREKNSQCAAPPAFPSLSFDLLRVRMLERSTFLSMSPIESWPPALNSTRNPSSAIIRAGHGGELIRNPGAPFSGMPEPPMCRHARLRMYMAG